jgi:hypothetical protein
MAATNFGSLDLVQQDENRRQMGEISPDTKDVHSCGGVCGRAGGVEVVALLGKELMLWLMWTRLDVWAASRRASAVNLTYLHEKNLAVGKRCDEVMMETQLAYSNAYSRSFA